MTIKVKKLNLYRNRIYNTVMMLKIFSAYFTRKRVHIFEVGNSSQDKSSNQNDVMRDGEKGAGLSVVSLNITVT